jgi:hypothetical protein
MFLRILRASWQTIPGRLTILALAALPWVAHAAAQSSITVSVSPKSATVQAAGATQKFTATVRNDRHHRGVRWTLTGAGCSSGGGCGTLSASTSASGTSITYTAPAALPNPATTTLTATSISNRSKMASAVITLSRASPVSVSISPTSASVATSHELSFTATVTNDPASQGVAWALTQSGASCSSACGTLSGQTNSAVTYYAPTSLPANPLVILTARSVVETTKSASASITVTSPAPVSVTLAPKRAALAITQKLLVTATVVNDVGGGGVTWSAAGATCLGASCGTFTNVSATAATFSAPAAPGTYSITATSIADVTKSASSSIGVTDLSGVLTYHNNLSRDGTNTHEFALTPAIVNSSTFGKLFSCQADGAIYAQPLWVPNLTVAGATHNVIVVATQHESLYAFDADASPCTTLWRINLIDSAHGGTSGETSVPSSGAAALVGSGYGDISPEVGVTGTPVIDPSSNTIYVVSKSVNGSLQFFQRLHAIDLTTGNERIIPRSIDSSLSVAGNGAGSVAGQVTFDPRNENQRPGLVLSAGVVYVAWASHEDHDPYHGWVIGFNASTLVPTPNALFNSTPNQVGTLSYSRGGIWMGGGAPAVDSSGNLYFITGNGTFDANTGGSNYGDSVVKLSTTNGLSVADYFTPLDQASLDANDTDFGSGAATILIDQPAGPVTHLVIGGGKQGNLFLLNRDNLGKFSGSTNNVVETVSVGNPIFATPVFWQSSLYVAGVGPLKQFAFNPAMGKFNGAPFSQSAASYGFPGATPSLSSNGASNAILWALDNSLYCTPQSPGCGATVLRAYDATNLASELWNSSQAAGNRDQAGHAVKFTVPTVANGKVYVGTRGNDTTVLGELEVYGLLPN